MMDTSRAALICASLGCLVYLNSLGLTFCFDDEIAIVRNQDIRSNTSWSNLLHNDFWGTPMSSPDSHKSYRPLTVATFRLNYMLHELQPLGYHLVNVLLHSAVCYLYVLLCGVVFSEVWPALIAGLLFAVHPIHTEAVSGVVARADILSALLFLMAVISYRQVFSSKTKLHEYGGLLLTLLLVLCSALSKEIGITAVAICLLYELLILRKFNVGDIYSTVKSCKLPPWFAKLTMSSLIFGTFTITFLVMRVLLNQGPPKLTYVETNPAVNFPTPLRQLHWSYLCVLNLWLLLSPSQLCAEYAMGTIPPISSLTDPRNLLTLATFAGLLSMGCYAMSTRDGHQRKLLFGLCLMTIPFIPASNLFFPVGFVIAERVLYIPSMGFCMVVGYGAWRLASNKTYGIAAKVMVTYLLVFNGLKTYTRNQDWYDNLTLFSSALKTDTKDIILLNNLASTLQKAENLMLAEAVLKHSADIDPLHIPSRIKLAHLLKKQDRFEEAIEIYESAEKLITRSLSGETRIIQYPNNTRVYMQLASMLLRHTERHEEAYRLTRKAAMVEPEWEEPYNLMGKCLFQLGRVSEAAAALKKSVELKEDSAEAHVSLGEVLLELGQLDEAELHFRTASGLDSPDFLSQLRLVKLILDHSAAHTTDRLTEALNIAQKLHIWEPENGNVTVSLALLSDRLGDTAQAVTYLEEVLAGHPDLTAAYLSLSRQYYKLNQYAEAKDVLTTYLERSPNDPSALFHMGTILMSTKDYEGARPFLTGALERNPNDENTLVNYGLLLIYTRENEKALELFQRLARDYPHNKSYAEQVSIIEQTLKRTSEPSKTETSASEQDVTAGQEVKPGQEVTAE